MRERILTFLNAIDSALVPLGAEGERLNLYVIGKAAVILFYEGEQAGAMTSDVDVVQISNPPERLLLIALEHFGEGTLGAKTHGLYLEKVHDGIPPLAGSFRRRCTRMDGDWKILDVWQPDANDLAASKLKRYASKDKEDVRHPCDQGLVQKEKLQSVLQGAFLRSTEDDGDPDRERAFANLKRVFAYLDGESRGL